jgi:hypothetical protein
VNPPALFRVFAMSFLFVTNGPGQSGQADNEKRSHALSYTLKIADALADTPRVFVTLNRHQLVGNVANIEYWFDEAIHCLGVIDGFRARFQAIKSAQAKYVRDHDTVAFRPGDDGAASIPPARPNLSDYELKRVRREVVDAAYAFARRAFKESLIPAASFRALAERIGTTIDPQDAT